MKNKRIFFLVFWWVLTVAVMSFIFYFSSENAEQSSATSTGFLYWLLNVFFPDFSHFDESVKLAFMESIHGVVRKCAHFTVFAALGFCSLNAFRFTLKLKIHFTALICAAFCYLYAVSDEIHQLFEVGRSCEFFDTIIDFGGSVCGILFSFLIFLLLQNRKRKS